MTALAAELRCAACRDCRRGCTTRACGAARSSPSAWRACLPRRFSGALAAHGVNTSVSLASYAQLDLPHRGLPDLVRASVHYYNTDAELDRLIAALPGPRP